MHKSDASSKAAPTPPDVEAQVAAGQKVRIPITLTGIDTDGDDVQLFGLGNKAPTLGRIARWAPTTWSMRRMRIRPAPTRSPTPWRIGPVSATAQVRVGVFQSDADSGVYASDDEITLRPNTAATVPVAQNDISGDNTDLTVAKDVESQGLDGVSR